MQQQKRVVIGTPKLFVVAGMESELITSSRYLHFG